MAWQGQKDIQTSKYPHMALNLDIWGINHSGSTLTFSATVRAVVTSGNIRYNGVTVSLTGGGSITKNMNPVSTGGYVDFGTFNCTVTNVPASTTSYNITASLSAGSVASGSATWTVNIGSGGSAPSGGNITFNSSTWNKINATSSVSSWGGLAGSFQSIVVTGSYNGDAVNATSENFRGRKCYVGNAGSTSVTTFTTDMSNSNVTMTFENPISIKGLLCYRLAYWHSNSAGVSYGIKSTVRHLPPAKPQFTYTDPGGSGVKSYTVNLTGDLVNNHTTYDAANLTRSIRYKIDSGNWVNVDSDTVAALDFVTAFTVAVPAGSTATVEGWMTYHGLQSEVQTITITNSTTGVALYGSVNGETKKLGPVYASVNGRTRKLKKIYASVGGVTKKVYEDV